MKADLRDVRDGVLLVEYPALSDDEANRAAVSLGRRLREAREVGILDAVPGARSLLVVFDPDRLGRESLARRIERASPASGKPAGAERLLRIPVVYDGEDLDDVARGAGISTEEAARRHAAARYRVAFVGFAPGFAYLSGLPSELAAARLPTPRPRVPAGSVAIGGPWTGVYPSASPGGWRLIGRTSVRLYDPRASPPALLEPGDRVEFLRSGAEDLVAPPPDAREPEPHGRPVARVLAPGLHTTVQGGARHGLGASGIPPGGAMDPESLAIANVLVGNAPGEPALEIALSGPDLEIAGHSVLAISGGQASVDRNGGAVPLREAFRVAAGDRVKIGPVTRGARVYLAVRGGVSGEPGRRLAAGDVLREAGSPPQPGGRAPQAVLPGEELVLRVVPGPEAPLFAAGEFDRFIASRWRVSAESDRRGLRLSGKPLAHAGPPEISPSGTVPGSIQVPGGGLPIVLGPDGPVTGGYPRIGTVISADLGRLGQARPGSILRFQVASLDDALVARSARGSTISLP